MKEHSARSFVSYPLAKFPNIDTKGQTTLSQFSLYNWGKGVSLHISKKAVQAL